MKFIFRKKNKRGFALLFSVLLSSLLLTIGLSIFSITLKELAISTASRQSVHAFYAADSGRECALYWDIKRGEIPDLFSKDIGTINCGGVSKPLSGTYNPPQNYFNDPSASVVVDIPTKTDIPAYISVLNDTTIGPNYYVEITKTISDRGQPAQSATTTIISYGHDSTGGDRVERAINQTLGN
jgi:hypothetical protein